MAGTTLGFLKFVLGFDTLSFKKGMTDAERDLVGFQKKVIKLGGTMQALGVAMSAAAVPFAKFFADGAREAQETAVAMERVNNALSQTGSVAKQTAPELVKAASALEAKSLYEADQILGEVSATLLRFGKIAPENFQRAQQAAVDFAAVTGKPLTESALAIGKAMTSPTKGMRALQAVGITLNKAQIAQLETWNKTGQAAKTQATVLGLLDSKIKGAAEAAANADPWTMLSHAYKNLAEIIGTTLLPYIKSFITGLTGVLNALAALGPVVQGAVVAFGAFLIVVGPVTTALGTFFTIIGKTKQLAQFTKDLIACEGGFLRLGAAGPVAAEGLVATAEGEAVAATGAAALDIALAPILLTLGALALAVTAVVVAWDNWSVIAGFVEGVYQSVKKWISDELGAIWDWLEKTLASVVDWFSGLLDAVPFVRALYNGVKGWVVDKIGSVWNWLKGALTTVVGWFGDMVESVKKYLGPIAHVIGKAFGDAFDAVSAKFSGFKVPDIVAPLKSQAANVDLGLDDAVAKSGKKAAKKAGDAKKKIKKAVEIKKADLFTPQEIDLSSPEQHRTIFGSAPIVPHLDLEDVLKTLPQMAEANKKTTEEMAQAWADLGKDAVGSMKDMVAAFKSGDILGGIQSLLDVVLDVIKALAQVGLIHGNAGTAGAAPSGARAGITARAAGGPVVPGRTYMVGEKGPEFFSTGRRGFITPNGKDAQPQRLVVVPSAYFDVVVDNRAAGIAAPMAGRAAVMGAAGAEARAVRRSKRNLLAAA